MVYDNANFLGLLVSDTQNDVPVSIQGYRMSGRTAKQLNSNFIILVISIYTKDKIIAFLKFRISGEVGEIGDVIQRAVNYAPLTGDTTISDCDVFLQITDRLSEYGRFTIFRFNSEAD